MGRRPVLLVPLPFRVGKNLTATKEMRHNHPGQPLGWPKWLLRTPCFQDNSQGNPAREKRQKREEKERAHHRKTSPTPLPRQLERDARWPAKTCAWARVGYEALWPAGTLAFGLWHGFVSAQTRNLFLSFLELLVTAHGVQDY